MMKSRRRWLWLLVVPLVLPFLLIGALYLPPVQRWAVDRVTTYVERQTGLNIDINQLRLRFLLDLDLQGLCVTQGADTLLAVNHAVADVSLKKLWRGEVSVKEITLKNGRVDSHDFLDGPIIRGQVGEIGLKADHVNLKERSVMVDEARLADCDLLIDIAPSEKNDTTESNTLPWNFNVDRLSIDNTHLNLWLRSDSIHAETLISEARLAEGDINLSEGIYKLKSAKLNVDSLNLDLGYDLRAPRGLDVNHLRLADARLEVKNFVHSPTATGGYKDKGTLKIDGVKEACGLTLTNLETTVEIEDDELRIERLNVETPHSHVMLQANGQMSALTQNGSGQMKLKADAQVGHQDLLAIADSALATQLRKYYPPKLLTANLEAEGNIDSLLIHNMEASMDGIAHMEANGWVAHALDSTLPMAAEADIDLRTQDLSMVNKIANSNAFTLPPMTWTAGVAMRNGRINLDALMNERHGRAHLVGWVEPNRSRYDAKLNTQRLSVSHFLKDSKLGEVSLTARLSGNGYNMMDALTHMDIQTEVKSLKYDEYMLDGLAMQAGVNKGRGRLQLSSSNPMLTLDACAEADMDDVISNAIFDLDLHRLDARGLGLTPDSLIVSMVLHATGNSDLNETHQLNLSIKDLQLTLPDTVFYPHNLNAALDMKPEQMWAQIEAGDLSAQAQSGQGLTALRHQIKEFWNEVEAERREYTLRQDTLKTLLPNVSLSLTSGNDNPVANIMQTLGYTMESLKLQVRCDSVSGINGHGHLLALNTGAVQLDTISMKIFQDTKGVRMEGRVKNSPKNRVVSFESLVGAELTSTGANASLLFYDAKGRKGVDLGLRADVMENGTRIHFEPLNPVIAYRNFKLNEDNFIEMTNDHRIEALVDLLADDGTGLKFYSTDNPALQDLTLNVNHFNVGELTQVLPYMPRIGGLLHGDLHYVQEDSTTLSISTDMTVQKMTYENAHLGDIGLNAVYLPNADGTHYVDGIITQNEQEIILMQGQYRPEKDGNHIDGNAQLQRLPLNLANGFIPDKMAEMMGYVEGELEVSGTTARPLLTGTLATDSMALTSVPYNLNLRFPNDTLRIKQSHINLDRIEAYAVGKEPLTLDGTIDFSNLDAISMDVTVMANNYQLINAPKQRNSLAYGKANVNMRGRLRGTLDNLRMRGRLTVLGNTDLTYVLQDSPLTVEDRLADLVTFVDFTDTIETEYVKKKRQYVDMQIAINIEQAAQFHCLLSETGQDYVNLEGGGDLTLSYDNQNGMQLNGRYTILSGEMNYTILPVVGSKHFNIDHGSYVEFRGDMSNPTLNVKAHERMKSSVTENNIPRSVAFNVGLKISQTLDNMGLEFTLEAPEDISVQNELASLSSEDRGRVAVTMLATGMYLNDLSNTGGFNTSNTLNSYLQNEINNLVSMAQSTIDVNVGIENTTNEMGNTQTDYSFSFAKRFWGNRISIIIGGKVSSGSDAQNTGQSIIDNISLEYRLDESATRYVRIYYDHNYESLLEGEITEMGAGVVFRRKSEKLGDLFIFKKKKDEMITAPKREAK